VRDGGQSLHVVAEDPSEGFGFGFTQLRELLSHVRDRAVMLTNLCARGSWLGACREAKVTQRVGESGKLFGGGDARPTVAETLPKTLFELSRTLLGERMDSSIATRACHKSERMRCERVVVRRELGAPGIADGEDPRGSTSSARRRRAIRRTIVELHQTVCQERIEMTANRRGTDAQPLGQGRSGGRSGRHQGSSDPIAPFRLRSR